MRAFGARGCAAQGNGAGQCVVKGQSVTDIFGRKTPEILAACLEYQKKLMIGANAAKSARRIKKRHTLIMTSDPVLS